MKSMPFDAVRFLNRIMPIPGTVVCVGVVLLSDHKKETALACTAFLVCSSFLVSVLNGLLKGRNDKLEVFERLHAPIRSLMSAVLLSWIVFTTNGKVGVWIIAIPLMSVTPAIVSSRRMWVFWDALMGGATLGTHWLVGASAYDLFIGGLVLLITTIMSFGLISAFQRVALNAQAAERAKAEFLANMSHEIRTPLNGVLGTLELLARSDDEENRQLAHVGRKSALGLLTILNDVLDYSKIEAGKLCINLAPFKTQELVSSLRGEFGLGEQGCLSFSIDQGFPRALDGDFTRVLQVLRNFVSNAVKFSRGNEVTVTFSLVGGTDGPLQKFSVTDRGIGMTKEQLNRVFEKFEQAEAHTTKHFGGTGLGLAIARNLAERMGGHIEAESELGKGSTFSLILQLQESEAPASEGSLGAIGSVKSSGPQKSLALRVLVVDDNKINRMVAEKMLKSLGHAACSVDSAQSAIERFQEEPYDVVLMDCQMPQVDGFEATQAIRALKNYKGTPIIALTASVFAEDRERCLEAGMVGFLSKPVVRTELAKALTESLSHSPKRTPPDARTPSNLGDAATGVASQAE